MVSGLVICFVPFLVLRCQTLLPPLNGFLVGDCDNRYGSTCKTSCDNGYLLLGSETLTCLHKPGHIKGYWDKSAPVCKSKLFNVSNTKDCVLPYSETSRRELKIRRVAEYTSRCLEMWSNTILSV